MTRPTLGKTHDGATVTLDLDRLIGSRMLLQANSGAGKSWAIRRLVEQTHGQVQQIILDTEGEFYTLREKLDFVLAGRGGDCPADPKSAHLLARRLLELGVSAVIDLSELAKRDRVAFVRRFLEALLEAPRKLWHPALIVIDEAHVYAPEKGEAESASAVADLMSRGRKRAFCGILATQRLAKLAKDSAAEANNLLIGRASLDADMKRAADALGFAGRDERNALRRLKPGEFYAFGPALCDEVTSIRVGPVKTSHPKAGAQAAPPAPPRAQVKAALSKLADLPAEAEHEAQTVAALQSDLREAKRSIRKLESGRGAPSADQLESARDEGRRQVRGELARVVSEWTRRTEAAAGVLDRVGVDVAKLGDLMREPLEVDMPARPAPIVGLAPGEAWPGNDRRSTRSAARPPAPSGDAPALGGGCLRMLTVLASRSPAGFTIAQWATLAGLKRTGGTWSTYLSRLRTNGYVEKVGDLWHATDDGIDACGEVPPAPESPEEVLAMWKGRLGGGAARMLDAIVEAPGGLTRDDLAEAVGITRSGGTFGTYLSRIRSNGLVEEEGDLLRASSALL